MTFYRSDVRVISPRERIERNERKRERDLADEATKAAPTKKSMRNDVTVAVIYVNRNGAHRGGPITSQRARNATRSCPSPRRRTDGNDYC